MAAKGRRPSGSKSVKPKHVLVVVAVVGLGFIALKIRPKKMTSKAPAREASVADEPAIQELPLEDIKPHDSKAYKEEVARKRVRFAARALLGLKSLELKETDGFLNIPFVFTPEKVWCQGGDLDTMKFVSKNIVANDILISLEPSGNEKGDSLRTSVAALYKGLEYTFKVKPGSARSYGLYICSDTKNEKSCKNKTLKTHEAMTNEVSAADGSAKDDYIFYFQHVVFDKNSLEVYRSNDASDEFKKSIETYLTKQKSIDTHEFQTAWKVSKVIRSNSADVEDGRLHLILPYNDPRCMNQGR